MKGGPGGLCKHPPLLIQGEMVECVDSITFLGLHITSDLTAEEGQSCCPHSPGIRTVHTAAI